MGSEGPAGKTIVTEEVRSGFAGRRTLMCLEGGLATD